MHDVANDFERALLALDRAAARRVLEETGAGLEARLEALVVPALDRIGARWEAGELALSQVYMAGRIAEDLVTSLAGASRQLTGTPPVALALLEDYHQLGKRIVASTLVAAGVPFVDLGRVTVEELVERTAQGRYRVLLVSVLMLSSARKVARLVERLAEEKLDTRVVVGGAPFRLDPQLGPSVGAHATGTTAADAVRLTRAFLEPAPGRAA